MEGRHSKWLIHWLIFACLLILMHNFTYYLQSCSLAVVRPSIYLAYITKPVKHLMVRYCKHCHCMTLKDSVLCDIVMAALHSRCGHYILQLWFLLVSFFFSFFFFSRLFSAVSYWMQIQNAGLKYAACGSLKIQDATNCEKIAICAPSHNFVGLYLRS